MWRQLARVAESKRELQRPWQGEVPQRCSTDPPGLPEELWGCIALWLLPEEFVRLSWCRSQLFIVAELQTLWHHFCCLRGYVRRSDSVVDIAPLASSPAASRGLQGSEIALDWRRLVQVNAEAQAEGGAIFCWVWVNGEEVRLPAAREAPAQHVEDSLQRSWLLAHGWRPPAELRLALLRVLPSPCPVPFRLREVVAGRPGFSIKRACFFAGDCPTSCAVEWPLGQGKGGHWLWPLPPQATLEPDQQGEDWKDDPSFRPGPHPWDRGQGLLLQLLGCPPPDLHPQATRRDLWVRIGVERPFSSLTLGDLCRELVTHLPSLGLPANAQVRPANFLRPCLASEELQPHWLLLRDLRWTQAERLYLYEATSVQTPRVAGAFQCSQEEGRPVLFYRSSARIASGVTPGCTGEEDEAACRGSECLSTGHVHRGCHLDDHLSSSSSSSSGCCSLSGSSHARRQEVPVNRLVTQSQGLLLSSCGARQFEFHPIRRDTMLIGRKDGTVLVLDNKADVQTHSLEVDAYPILGLSWLHTQPQWAVVGASQSGTISLVRYDECRPGRMEQIPLEPFSHLSSLSVNCTDDYLMTSGFCVDLGLYDIVTGRRLSTFRGMHQNFINILRFAHRSPHLFATASFDHTCKVWDLRGPICAERPAQLLGTQTLNVMCCFSPDDRHLLCSGVDEALQQFRLQARSGASHFPLPSLGSHTNYRRSLYLANGSLVGTAATNESLVRIYTAAAPHRPIGCIDFRSMLRQRRPMPLLCDHGSNVEDSGDSGSEEDHGEEYVQSLRCHPKDPSRLAALLSTCDRQPESYISVVQLREATCGYAR